MAGAAVEPFTCLDDSDAADALIRWVVMPAGDASAVLLLGQHAVRVGETAAASSLGVIDFDAEKNEVYGFSDAVPCAAAQRGSRAAFFAMPLVSKAVRQWWVGARIWRELCIQWFSPHRVPEVLSVQHDKEAFLQHVSRAFMRQLQELEQELWYYQGGSGEIHGPEPLARMRALLELQHITDDTMVRRGDQGIFRKLRAYARVVYRPIIDLEEIEQPHQLIVGLQFGGTSRRSVGAPSADKTRMDTLSCNLVLGSKNFFLGEPTELIVAVDSQESSRAAEVERDRDSRLCRARTGCFYPTPQFAADRAHWIALARSLVLCWENHTPLPFGGMNCPYRPERARQDFTLTLDLHTPRQELLQDFVFQCIADPDVMRRKAAGFDEVEHQRALAAHKFLSEPGAIPAITFSAVPKKKSHRRTPAAPRRARETLALDLDDAELADAELAADLAINAEDELEGRLLEQVSSTAAFAPLTGFDFSTDVISEDAAAKLLAHLDTAPWVSDRDGRRVQVYGTWNFLDETQPPLRMPTWVRGCLGSALDDGFTELLVTEYQGGDTLPPHIDRMLWGPKVVGLSLLSAATMELSNPSTGEVIARQRLPSRSMYSLAGVSRSHYCHSITDIQSRRISLTFRTMAKYQEHQHAVAVVGVSHSHSAGNYPQVAAAAAELERMQDLAVLSDSDDGGEGAPPPPLSPPASPRDEV